MLSAKAQVLSAKAQELSAPARESAVSTRAEPVRARASPASLWRVLARMRSASAALRYRRRRRTCGLRRHGRDLRACNGLTRAHAHGPARAYIEGARAKAVRGFAGWVCVAANRICGVAADARRGLSARRAFLPRHSSRFFNRHRSLLTALLLMCVLAVGREALRCSSPSRSPARRPAASP